MEIASAKWLSELEMEDPTLFPQYPTMNPIDFSFDDFNFESFSPESYTSYTNIDHSHGLHIEASHNVGDDDFRRPMKQLKTSSSNWKSSCITDNIPPKAASSSSSHIISFDNSNSSPPDISQHYCGLDRDLKRKNEVSKRVGSSTRAPLYAQDHVIAERKRREKLSQRFISLSALIPGLKKNDKASVLGDAIKYLKQLQERVGTLENQVATKTMESVIIVRKTQIYSDDETSSCGENFESQSNNPFPEIEARVSEKDVLIRIHCEKNKGCIPNIINEVEKLHLCVLNTNVLPFGQATLDITIVAQVIFQSNVPRNSSLERNLSNLINAIKTLD
ncbi:transcription factor bHLH19 isoform X3 [Gossypium raimondii]|uniref:transcription factor bHLH19 isoform X3 n=1 Tax=Gossypium raimondii TaxID=29730 RepID=UPI00227ABE95|nr:transcription factor bHLH19 isoform X3 [Gossypium raimondii]